MLAKIGLDPLEEMAHLARADSTPIALRARLLIELSMYVYPKRKSIELGIDGDAEGVSAIRRIIVDWRRDECDARDVT